LAVAHDDGGVAVGVAFDGPFEAEVEEGRVFDGEASGFGGFWAAAVAAAARRQRSRERWAMSMCG